MKGIPTSGPQERERSGHLHDFRPLPPGQLLRVYTADWADPLRLSVRLCGGGGCNSAQPAQPVLSISVGSNFGLFFCAGGLAFAKTDQSLREVASLLKGNHELQFGGEIARIRLPMQNRISTKRSI